MESVFLKLVNMSITASYLVAVVLVLRLLLKKAPKWLHCALWALVALRLMLPFSLESTFSMIPSVEPLPEEFLYAATPQIDSGMTSVDLVLNPVIAESLTPVEPASANPTQILSFVFSQFWCLGMVLMLLYAAISYLIVRRKVRVSIALDKTIHLCDHIDTPFILGIIRPKIYLPSELDPTIAAHVLSHEQAHLKRRDHWWKPLGFGLLSIYWFNPVLWLAYILLCRDIEQACDEKVVKDLDNDGKKAYSMALLRCSVPRRMIAACPLAFGEVSVKDRIKSVLNYKKPAFWVVLVAIIACVAAAVCFLTDPKDTGTTPDVITSNLWFHDAERVDVTVWNDDESHGVSLSQTQIQDLCKLIHELEADDFIRQDTSKHKLHAVLDCKDFDIELHWDGEYTCFSFDPISEEQITSKRRAVKDEALNAFLADVAGMEYRLAEGTYVPVAAFSLFQEIPDALDLLQTRRYVVTKDGLTISNLVTGDVTAYAFEWSWEGHREATENLSDFVSVNDDVLLSGIYLDMSDQTLKYQHLFGNSHLLLQNGGLYLVEGSMNPESGDADWTVYELRAYSPHLLPPSDYPTLFKDADKYVTGALAFARSGDCRPGYFSLTEDELEILHGILAQLPAGAIQPGSEMKDYYTALSVSCKLTYELKCGASFLYCDGKVGMQWNSYGTEGAEYYQVDYAPLTQFLAGLMQPERIEFHSVMFDMDHPEYITYTHDDITISLLKLIPWEYEIVPYVDDHTDFGIRCKPEWLDDWLFFGYMQGELVPESTFLHEATVEYDMLDAGWHYLFEHPIAGTTPWREWPEPWKMLYRHADGGTYYIYNEGAFDERSREHDGGGFTYIEQSFDFCLLDEETAIDRSKRYIFVQEHENPEVYFDADANNYLITWQKMDSDGYTVVRLGPINSGILTEVTDTESE